MMIRSFGAVNGFGLFLLSAFLAFVASLVVAGFFMPIYGIFQGGTHNCLNTDLMACLSMVPFSAFLYGPLFCIGGVLVGTPVFMVILALRA